MPAAAPVAGTSIRGRRGRLDTETDRWREKADRPAVQLSAGLPKGPPSSASQIGRLGDDLGSLLGAPASRALGLPDSSLRSDIGSTVRTCLNQGEKLPVALRARGFSRVTVYGYTEELSQMPFLGHRFTKPQPGQRAGGMAHRVRVGFR